MICDDDKGVRIAIKNLLFSLIVPSKAITMSIEETFNGIECLYKIYSDCKNGVLYDLLLIDENMPYMNGSTLVQDLNEMKNTLTIISKIKLISITGDCLSDNVKFLKSKGFDDVIFKPVTRTELQKLINGIINNYHSCK